MPLIKKKRLLALLPAKFGVLRQKLQNLRGLNRPNLSSFYIFTYFISNRINKNKNIKNSEPLAPTKKVTWVVNQNELSGILPIDFQKVNDIHVYVLKITQN